jgi:DNA invertase Pin-like site-specific DNA recombinase
VVLRPRASDSDNGVHFRSLGDPIDTTTPQGMFSLQVLGAVAQFERAPIAERTKSSLHAAPRRRQSRPTGWRPKRHPRNAREPMNKHLANWAR